MSVIFLSKLNSLLINSCDAMIANRNLMCISSQVFNHLVRTTERSFGIHYKGGSKQLVEKFRWLLRKYFPQTSCIPGPEYRSYCFYLIEKLALAAGALPLDGGSNATSRNYTMQVRMKCECLPTSMQDANHAGLSTKVFWIRCKGLNGAPGGRK